MRTLVSGTVLSLALLACNDGSEEAPRPAATTPAAAVPAAEAGAPAVAFMGKLVRFDPAPGLFRSIREEPEAGCPEMAANAAGGAVALTRSHESGLRIMKRRTDLATLAAQAGFKPEGSRWILPGSGRPRPADHFRSANWDALYGEWSPDTTAAGAGSPAQANLVALFPRQDGCSIVFMMNGGDPMDLGKVQAALNSVVVVPE